VAALCGAVIMLSAACTKNSEGTTAEKTTASPSGSTSSSATPTPTPSLTVSTKECSGVVPVTALDTVVGQPIIGMTNFVVGVADPTIDRLAYINCKYGITQTAGQPDSAPQVEIGVSQYSTAAVAATRVQGTVEAYRNQGATSSTISIGTDKGTILVGSGDPTLVVASGNKTVAVTVIESLMTAANREQILSGIAARALLGINS
jgi:hypothetical protein